MTRKYRGERNFKEVLLQCNFNNKFLLRVEIRILLQSRLSYETRRVLFNPSTITGTNYHRDQELIKVFTSSRLATASPKQKIKWGYVIMIKRARLLHNRTRRSWRNVALRRFREHSPGSQMQKCLFTNDGSVSQKNRNFSFRLFSLLVDFWSGEYTYSEQLLLQTKIIQLYGHDPLSCSWPKYLIKVNYIVIISGVLSPV